MPSELERQLEGLLLEAPEPEPAVGDEALRRAVAALDVRRPPRRIWISAVALAATLVLLAAAAGALAAVGALHVSFGNAKPQRTAPPTQALTLPAGANGIAAVIDGRLSVVTRSGFRLQGLPVSAAVLSPHALYVAAGIGSSLVAMAPDGHRAWSHPTGGTVVAIAWAPDGLRIAYVVRAAHGLVLHVIWGNGTRDSVIDRGARAVRPSWRADSLAFAYVGGGGRAIVYDLTHASRTVIRSESPVTHVAFRPSGKLLAIATPSAVEVVGRLGVGSCSSVGIGWLGRKIAVGCRTRFLGLLFPSQAIRLPGRIEAIDASGQRLAMALATSHGVLLVVGTPSHLRTIERLPAGARLSMLGLG